MITDLRNLTRSPLLIDLSPSAFAAIANKNDGVFRASWNFMNKNWHP